MGIFSKFSDMSRVSRLKSDANDIIRRADQDYQELASTLNYDIEAFNSKAKSIYDRKIKFLQSIKYPVGDIKTQAISSVNYDHDSKPDPPENYGEAPDGVKILFNSDYDEILDDAEYFYDSAESYRNYINLDIKDMQELRASMKILDRHLEEESKFLSAVETSMKVKRDFDSKKIANKIHLLLTEKICDSNGRANSRYENILTSIRAIGI